MLRIAAFTALWILLAPAALFAQTADSPGTWAFQPARDEFRPDALLDLRIGPELVPRRLKGHVPGLSAVCANSAAGASRIHKAVKAAILSIGPP